MNTQLIDFEQTNAFSTLFLDYIQGNEKLKPFYGLYPNPQNFRPQIDSKKKSTIGVSSHTRQILQKSLIRQYQNIAHKPSPQIELLTNPSTFTVTTGHQLSLFTGPLYFIFKIITTINLANELKKLYPEYNFVPVYWMASEDHDFAEINHFHLFGKTLTWLTEQKGAVGRFKTEGIAQIFAELNDKLPIFEQAYLQNNNLAEATRYLVNELFGKYGLVCIDGDDRELKSLFAEVMHKELFSNNAKTAFELVKQSSQLLENQGFKTQVTPREINFFYLENGLRERIVVDESNQKFAVLNTSLQFTSQELEKIIAESPEKFSPNVILRPLYQEYILPNLAYIGGPGELAYWLQLKGVFDNYRVPFPILMPRNFGMIVNKPNLKKITKLGIEIQDLFLNELALKEKFVQANSQNQVDLTAQTAQITTAFEQISQQANLIDKTLEGFVGAELQKNLKSVENIEKRLKKAEEQKLETEIKQLLGLKEKLFPQGELQERYDNFLNFYLNQPDILAMFLKEYNPFLFKMYIFQENE
ncbi:MAG: bacillithiol biosynthesis cysteine-adding enzyme BshC [Microscillaceae bacterium]|jgi:bacillithiol biosynthesis cysteine-adding enzyme BshC|nr:bacillithiol biosynthesis cysteine-adding enzyme BshC [Microscillaceae bacterium]